MNVKCEIKKGISKKSGKEFYYCVIEFPNGFKKTVFFDYAESFIVKTLVK